MDLDHGRLHAEIKETLDEIKTEVKAIRRHLLGNGKIGLVSQVLILWRGSVWFAGAVIVAAITFGITRML